jgi:hypothetical protein
MRRVLATRPDSCPIRWAGIGWTLTVSVLALAVLAVSPVHAAVAADDLTQAGTNLLTNPNFDTGITGWAVGPGATWDPSRDADGNPHSGSLQLSIATANSNESEQCVDVTPGRYELSGKILAPTGTYDAGSHANLSLWWYSSTPCPDTSGVISFVQSSIFFADTQNTWMSVTTGPVVAPAGARTAHIFMIEEPGGNRGLTLNFDDFIFKAVVGTCVANSTTLCIDDTPGDHRFSVVVSFATSEGGGLSGSGEAIPLASLGVTHGGLFWFFGADNPEMLIKVLNACSLNQKYWVFFAAVTNVGFTVTVTDTVSGQQRRYHSPDRQAAAPVQDTSALPCN